MRLRVATITSPKGIKGEVFLYPQSDIPQTRLAKGSKLFLENEAITIVNVYPQKNLFVAKISGIENREAAEKIRGKDLFVDVENEEIDSDEWFYYELIGLKAKLEKDGSEIGEIISIFDNNGQDLLEIKLAGFDSTIELPFVKEIISEVNLEEEFIVISEFGEKVMEDLK